MYPNLIKVHSISVAFSASIRLPKDIVGKIFSIRSAQYSGDAYFYDKYDHHIGRVKVKKIRKRPREQDLRCLFDFIYVPTDDELKLDNPKIERLMGLISAIRDIQIFDCKVAFKYEKKDNPRPIINIPLILTESPKMPFDEISGMHVVKHDGKKIRYHVYLDTWDDSGLFVNTLFDFAAAITDRLPDQILANAKTILDSFTSEEIDNA